MINPFSRKFKEYDYIWKKNSDWVIYKETYTHHSLYLHTENVSKDHYGLWKKVDPELHDKPYIEIRRFIAKLPKGWYEVRVIPEDRIAFYEQECSQYDCQWRIDSKTIFDYDIAHKETAASIDCPNDIYDKLVQHCIKKGAVLYDMAKIKSQS